MKRAAKTTFWALVSLFLTIGADAVTPDAPSQYQGIVDRNVFNLRPPPAPVNPADLIKKEAPPKITLDGITTITGKKLTFLTVPPTKPGTPPQTLMLAEGQAEDDVEVTQIDEKAGVVKITNHGEQETLDFDHNGTKPVAAVPGGMPARPVTIPPIPAPAPANVQPFPNIIRPLRTLPTRNSSSPFGDNTQPAGGGSMGGPFNSFGQNQSSLTPDQQALAIEAQRMNALQNNDPIAKILPQTPHTQEVINGVQAPQ